MIEPRSSALNGPPSGRLAEAIVSILPEHAEFDGGHCGLAFMVKTGDAPTKTQRFDRGCANRSNTFRAAGVHAHRERERAETPRPRRIVPRGTRKGKANA
jgi:hypothetical protein